MAISHIDRTARPRDAASRAPRVAARRRKFLRAFPGGFRDETYLEWERNYKWEAHQRWTELLSPAVWRGLMRQGSFHEVAARAVAIESRTNLLFSFEKMALRDAVKPGAGARAFAEWLYEFLHGRGTLERRFERWRDVVAALPRRQTRVLTWPIVTVFGFLADPDTHIFLKPNVTRLAAERYGFPFRYESRPSWPVYASLLEFAETVRRDVRDLKPRDMIDLQSFIWVQGSEEYPER
ncbi:MAG TPA: hypothetical protein VE326_14900 [Candidatus Binatia bacterium]|nr:hypothetical protein [Candidatus Binatia bacterium]